MDYERLVISDILLAGEIEELKSEVFSRLPEGDFRLDEVVALLENKLGRSLILVIKSGSLPEDRVLCLLRTETGEWESHILQIQTNRAGWLLPKTESLKFPVRKSMRNGHARLVLNLHLAREGDWLGDWRVMMPKWSETEDIEEKERFYRQLADKVKKLDSKGR